MAVGSKVEGVSAGNRAGSKNRPSDPPKATVVVLDDDRLFRRSIARTLRLEGYLALEAEDIAELAALLDSYSVDVILADSRLADGSDGWREAEALALRQRGVRVVAISGYDLDAIEATGGSVSDQYVLKDGSGHALLAAVEAALSSED